MADISKNVRIVEEVRGHGGPCESAEDIDMLIRKLEAEGKSKTKIIDCFKKEEGYQKIIHGMEKNLSLEI